MNISKPILWSVIGVVSAGVGIVIIFSDRLVPTYNTTIPEATNYQLPVAQNTNVSRNTHAATTTVLPASKNLAVPFTSQAPDANWDGDHEE